MMTPAQLSNLSTLLYGTRWQSQLSRDLEINIRTVQRWAVNGAPDWVRDELHRKASIRLKTIVGLLK